MDMYTYHLSMILQPHEFIHVYTDTIFPVRRIIYNNKYPHKLVYFYIPQIMNKFHSMFLNKFYAEVHAFNTIICL